MYQFLSEKNSGKSNVFQSLVSFFYHIRTLAILHRSSEKLNLSTPVCFFFWIKSLYVVFIKDINKAKLACAGHLSEVDSWNVSNTHLV